MKDFHLISVTKTTIQLKYDVDFFSCCTVSFIFSTQCACNYFRNIFCFCFQEFIICVLSFLFAQSPDVSQPLLPFPTLHSLLEEFLCPYYFSKAYKWLELFLQHARQFPNCAVKLSPGQFCCQ